MSATGKNTLAIRKKDLAGQVNPSVAVKKLVFAHKFVGGETGFNLLALTTPTTEMVGFTNPSAAEIAQVSILINRNNLTLVSTAKNILMDYISFSPGSSTQINFASGVTALAGEVIVGTIQALISGGAVIADANPISVSGTLLAGSTDIIVPPFEALKNVTTSNIGAVMVVMDGDVKFRNPGNATAGAGQDTNNSHYEEVNAGNSMSTVIRMNTSEAFDRKYTVMSIGHSVFKPTESAMATVDVLAGQMDKVISVLADTSGQPTSYFQSNPNSVDLRAFGNTVYSHDASISTLNSKVAVIGDSVSVTAVGVAAAATNATGLIATLLIPAGTWFLRGSIVSNRAGATITAGNQNMKVSMTTTPTTDGTVKGKDFMPYNGSFPIDYSDVGLPFPGYTVTLASPTNYYLNGANKYSAGTPTWDGFMEAVRIKL